MRPYFYPAYPVPYWYNRYVPMVKYADTSWWQNVTPYLQAAGIGGGLGALGGAGVGAAAGKGNFKRALKGALMGLIAGALAGPALYAGYNRFFPGQAAPVPLSPQGPPPTTPEGSLVAQETGPVVEDIPTTRVGPPSSGEPPTLEDWEALYGGVVGAQPNIEPGLYSHLREAFRAGRDYGAGLVGTIRQPVRAIGGWLGAQLGALQRGAEAMQRYSGMIGPLMGVGSPPVQPAPPYEPEEAVERRGLSIR